MIKLGRMKLPIVTLAVFVFATVVLSSCKSSFAKYVDPLYLEDGNNPSKNKSK